jgi:hypothetical protein
MGVLVALVFVLRSKQSVQKEYKVSCKVSPESVGIHQKDTFTDTFQTVLYKKYRVETL